MKQPLEKINQNFLKRSLSKTKLYFFKIIVKEDYGSYSYRKATIGSSFAAL